MTAKITPKPFSRLGSVYDGDGVNFAIFSSSANYVEICLFNGGNETKFILPGRTDDGIWHGHIEGLKPGQLYGYRIYGNYEPHNGHRFNPNKLLLDPYAREFDGEFSWHSSLLGYNPVHGPNSFSEEDSARFVPKCIVIDDSILEKYPTAVKPGIPWHQSIIYEAHVKGYTFLNKDIWGFKRGSFSGMKEKKVISYLKSLGITALELLPVQACCTDRYLGANGLSNFWGYDTVGFFAPRQSYGQTLEFKKMVNALHDAGIEVILDVVYNHTGDSDETGPTLLFKGIDNAYYYRLDNYNKSFYKNYSGTGNVLNTNQPYVQKLIRDSLRHWEALGVDGFRFDLTSALGRDEMDSFSQNSQFFNMIKQDEILKNVKLIAEPWDASPEGFQLGNYPEPWRQWNGNYKNFIRTFLADKPTRKGDIATCLSGSDYIGKSKEGESMSINYFSTHDGFTMKDFFTYTRKMNQDNPWNNQDGENAEGYNCGTEGETKDTYINEERFLRMKNAFAFMMLSVGVPMINAGDEIARTQKGNNNAYCQDNDISWINWDIKKNQKKLKDFVSGMISIRKGISLLSRTKLLEKDEVTWYGPHGTELSGELWDDHLSCNLNYLLKEGKNSCFVMMNMGKEVIEVTIPAGKWTRLMTTLDDGFKKQKVEKNYKLKRLEIALLKKERDG